MKKLKYIFISMYLVLFCLICNKTLEVHAAETDAVIILGDSRSCSLSESVLTFGGWNKIVDNGASTSDRGWTIFQNSNVKLVIVEYGGGCLSNGAVNQCFEWTKNVINSQYLADVGACVVLNMFGIGDIGTVMTPAAVGSYNSLGIQFASELPENCVYYQCTVGPLDESGSMGQSGNWTNSKIRAFNSEFKSAYNTKIFDLYGYLSKKGYSCKVSGTDTAGVHYTVSTDADILTAFLKILNREVDKINNAEINDEVNEGSEKVDGITTTDGEYSIEVKVTKHDDSIVFDISRR